MSTKKERHEMATQTFTTDMETLALAKGDTLAHYEIANRIHHRYLSDSDYAARANECSFNIRALIEIINELEPQATTIRLEKAWGNLPAKFQDRVDIAKKILAKLASDLSDGLGKNYHMTSVMECSEKSFEAAADADVYAALIAMIATLNEKMTDSSVQDKFANLHSYIADEIKRTGKYRSRSTSVTSNLSEDCVRCAWAAVPDSLIWLNF